MKECIVLAAGFSSRMGSWKMTLPWRDTTVLESAIGNALAFCDRVIVVTGYRADELHQRYSHRPNIQLCYNARFQAGMFSSVRCGVAALSGGRFFITPGDMPAIDPAVYAQLWHYHSPRCLSPCYEGTNGHPVLLPAIMAEQILAAPEQSNLRTLMQAHGRESLSVTCEAIRWDLDTPEQYQYRRTRHLSPPL